MFGLVVGDRRALSLTALIALLIAIAVLRAPVAAASSTPCTPGDPACVGVTAGAPGRGAQGTSSLTHGRSGAGSGASAPDPCAKYPGGFYALCQANKGSSCISLYDEYFGTISLRAFNTFMRANECPTLPPAAKPPPTPAQLAVTAAASFDLPQPSGDRSPPADEVLHGYPFTYVNLWTYFWTDLATWRSLTATARAGGNYATVTAEPVSLTFNPGDGSAPVSCAGPGQAWVEADGNSAPTGGACGFQYTHITGPGYTHPVTSTQTIAWQLTWTGSDDTSGTLTERTTTTSGRLNVLQIQTVNN